MSACLIIRDEAEHLPGCLASLSFCDEIVVVDGGSSDASPQIAAAAGAQVLRHAWRGFAAQRNVAILAAHGDWILEVDADERVTPELRDEILAFLAAPPPGIDIAALPLREIFLGRALGPAAKYPMYRHRLFRRGAYLHDEARTVHEGVWPRGPVWAFAGDLEHRLPSRLRVALRDRWAYAQLDAVQASQPGSPAALLARLTLRPAAKLAYRALLGGGWRDGWRGLVRIGLDCVSDAMVCAGVLARRRSLEGRGARLPGQHAHTPGQRHGPVRLVGVALGRRATATTAAWLIAARAAGADVALVTDAPGAAGTAALPVRRVKRRSPLSVLQALDAEAQLRDIDALVTPGSGTRTLVRRLPPLLRGAMPPIDPVHVAPAAAARSVWAATGRPHDPLVELAV